MEMGRTKIEWADSVWNIITGCSPTQSPGCAHCYAKRMAQRLKGRAGYPKDDPFRVTFHPDKLDQPLHWKKPRRIFVVSMGDLFHEKVSTQEIVKILWITQEAKHHTYMFLTKRPERMHRIFYELSITSDFNTDNIWCGISASKQDDLDRWAPILLGIPEVKHFVSYEPALGPVDLTKMPSQVLDAYNDALSGRFWTSTGGYENHGGPGLDLIIAGGESGPGARPAHPDWFRRVRDDCDAAGVPFLLKQLGAWAQNRQVIKGAYKVEQYAKDNKRRGQKAVKALDEFTLMEKVGKKAAGRELDGQIWDQWPGE